MDHYTNERSGLAHSGISQFDRSTKLLLVMLSLFSLSFICFLLLRPGEIGGCRYFFITLYFFPLGALIPVEVHLEVR